MRVEAIVFEKSDAEYFHWLNNNRLGFVMNTTREMSPNYMVLHRTTCYSISEYHGDAEQGGFTERAYIKICSKDIESLRAWVRQNGRPDGSFSVDCAHCKPLYDWENSED